MGQDESRGQMVVSWDQMGAGRWVGWEQGQDRWPNVWARVGLEVGQREEGVRWGWGGVTQTGEETYRGRGEARWESGPDGQ